MAEKGERVNDLLQEGRWITVLVNPTSWT